MMDPQYYVEYVQHSLFIPPKMYSILKFLLMILRIVIPTKRKRGDARAGRLKVISSYSHGDRLALFCLLKLTYDATDASNVIPTIFTAPKSVMPISN